MCDCSNISSSAIPQALSLDTTWIAWFILKCIPEQKKQSLAIAREKQLKGWNRERKKKLIFDKNPIWRNLFDDLKTGTLEMLHPDFTEEKAGGTDPSTSSG
jgi:hypothetical protein